MESLTAEALDGLCREAEGLCRAVAPLDLGDRPVYVVPQSRTPAELRGQAGAAGYTSPWLDVALKDCLDWRGRGFACVFDDRHLARLEPERRRHDLLPTVLHELGHALACFYLWDPCAEEAGPPAARAPIVQAFAEALGRIERGEDEQDLPFIGHGHDWVRCILHLLWRSCYLAGRLVDEHRTVRPDLYGLPDALLFAHALGDEPERLKDTPLTLLPLKPLPEAYAELWLDTFRRHTDPARKHLSWEDGGPVRTSPSLLTSRTVDTGD